MTRRKLTHSGGQAGGVMVGLLVVVVGVVLLLNTLGMYPWSVWNGWWRFWPVFLILVGVDTLIGDSFIARLISVIVWVVVVYCLIRFFFYGVNPFGADWQMIRPHGSIYWPNGGRMMSF